MALAWREKERPTAEWANRYGGDFAAAMVFLEASELARRAELAREEAARKAERQRLRLRRAAAGFAALSLLLASGMIFTWDRYFREHKAYYNTS